MRSVQEKSKQAYITSNNWSSKISLTKDWTHSVDFERFLYFYFYSVGKAKEIFNILYLKTRPASNALNEEQYF